MGAGRASRGLLPHASHQQLCQGVPRLAMTTVCSAVATSTSDIDGEYRNQNLHFCADKPWSFYDDDEIQAPNKKTGRVQPLYIMTLASAHSFCIGYVL